MNKWVKWMLSLLLLSLMTAYDYPSKHDRPFYEQKGDVVWEMPQEQKVVAITFDDGPDSVITPQILDLLKRYDAKATFFVVGNRIDEHAEIIEREILEGHEIGNHTYNHIFFSTHHSDKVIDKEIELTRKKILEVSGSEGVWFRPPGGNLNDHVVESAKKYGYTVVLWSWHQDTNDWKSPGVNAIVNKVLNNVHNGDIILMHDNVKIDNNHSQTVQALEVILPELINRGYQFVTVSELVRRKYLLE